MIMIELSDLATFAAFLAMILPSYGAVFYVLKRTGWGERKSLFLDTWKVWLAWIISGLTLLITGLVIADNVRGISGSLWLIVMFPAVLGGTILAIASVLKVALRFKVDPSIWGVDAVPIRPTLPVWKTSVLASVLAMATFISLLGKAILVTKLYDWIYPRANYGIYDM